MKNWRMWLGFGAAVLLAAAGIAAAYVWWLADPVAAAVGGPAATIERGSLVVAVRALGSVAVPDRQTLTFGIGGSVSQVAVTEGSVVRAGDVVARLDPIEMELRVAQAQAAVTQSRANLQRVRAGPSAAEVIAASAALAAAEAKYDQVRAGPLAADVASAEAALRSAQAAYDQLVAGPSPDQLAVLKANVDRAQIALRQAQANYDRFAWREGYGASPQAAALEQATVDYEQALAAYNVAAAGATSDQLQRARAQVASARAQLERVRAVGATDEQMAALSQVTRARAELERLENSPTPEDLAIAQAQAEQAEIALEQARRQLEQATLRAPTGGTILSIHANVGQAVTAASPIVVLADLSRQRVQVAVHESNVGSIQVNQPATVRVDALPDQTLHGQVSEIAPVATVVGGLVVYAVTIDLDSSVPSARPGMVAEAEIETTRHEDVLLIPKGALRLREGRWTARVLRDGRVEEVAIEIGERQGRMVRVVAGLAAGERVLLNTSPLDVGWEGSRPWRLAFGL